MPIKFPLKQFLNPVFIETGLDKGQGVYTALRAGFPKIYSIEINPQSIQRVRQRFPRQVQNGRVTLIQGDSAKALLKLLEEIEERCTLWLDAHHSPLASMPTVLMPELAALAKHVRNDHTILIDDVRLFDGWGLTIADVSAALRRINPDYIITTRRGHQGRQDILAAIPPK